MPSLGEMLVADGVCSVEQLKAAVENQVILGGRIGTNLVELGSISEETLVTYLSKQLRVRALYGDDIRPDREALALLKPEAVDRLNVIPYRREERSVQVLCVDPRDLKSLDEVAFITGLKPVPILVCEIRFWQLLHRIYGISREMRHMALDRAYQPVKVDHRPQTEPSVHEDLISEEVFAKLYQRREDRELVQAAPDQEQWDDLPVLAEEDLEVVEEEEEILELVEEVPPDQSPVQPEEGPLDFKEAARLLQGVDDRDTVARVVLRFAASVFKRCLLFTAHRSVVLGWDAIGGNIDRNRFRSLAIPLDSPSVFQLVTASRSHYLGALRKTRINIGFLKAMGKQVPKSAVLVPILVRGRVVNLIYCDNGHRAHAVSDIGELLILAQHIARCYESMFERRWVSVEPKSGPERRKFRRIPADFKVHFKTLPEPGRTRNISDGGIQLSSPARIEVGTVLEIELRTEAHSMFPAVFKPMLAKVRVVRVEGEQPPYQIGAEFVEIDEQ